MRRRIVDVHERRAQGRHLPLARHEASLFAIVETHRIGNRVGQQVNAVARLRRQPHACRISARVLLLKINFVAHDDARERRGQRVHQALGHRCAGLNNHQREIGVSNGRSRALNAHRLDGIGGVTQSRCVNHLCRQALDADSGFHGVARGARNRRHDGNLVTR